MDHSMTEPVGKLETDSSANPKMIAGTIGLPICVSALRCTLQYLLLPLMLPIFSISAAFSPLLNAAIGLTGVALIIFNVKRLWNTTWRWRYFAISLVVVSVLIGMIYADIVSFLATRT